MKLCVVSVFPDIVRDCPKIRNLPKIFLRSLENVDPDSLLPSYIVFPNSQWVFCRRLYWSLKWIKCVWLWLCVEVWEALYDRASEAERGMYITTLLLHPRSVGTIRLQSSNPQDDPLIDPRLLNDSDDVSTLIDG